MIKAAIPAEERLILALDVPTAQEAMGLVEELGDTVRFYKLGLELFMAGGYWELVDWLKGRGKRVFVDLKFFDVPATVASAVRALEQREVDFATVHGNDAILRAAAEAKAKTQILGVTVLTSLDEGDLRDLGFACDPATLVLSRARRALEVGCDGVVSSGLEAAALRDELGERLLIICPGIRPVENKPVDDQKRTVDVRTAFTNGADYIVVGRPIRSAENPRAKAEEMIASIREALARPKATDDSA